MLAEFVVYEQIISFSLKFTHIAVVVKIGQQNGQFS